MRVWTRGNPSTANDVDPPTVHASPLLTEALCYQRMSVRTPRALAVALGDLVGPSGGSTCRGSDCQIRWYARSGVHRDRDLWLLVSVGRSSRSLWIVWTPPVGAAPNETGFVIFLIVGWRVAYGQTLSSPANRLQWLNSSGVSPPACGAGGQVAAQRSKSAEMRCKRLRIGANRSRVLMRAVRAADRVAVCG
jgi:hypothetical protein